MTSIPQGRTRSLISHTLTSCTCQPVAVRCDQPRFSHGTTAAATCAVSPWASPSSPHLAAPDVTAGDSCASPPSSPRSRNVRETSRETRDNVSRNVP